MTKPYSVEVDVTTRWTVRIDADSEDEAWDKVEGMTVGEIEENGDFKDELSVEVNNAEEITDVE